MAVLEALARGTYGHHNVLLALRVNHQNLLFVDLEQLVFLHKHVNDLFGFRQISDRFRCLNHDITRFGAQNNIRQNSNRVLVRLDAHVDFSFLVVRQTTLRHCVSVFLLLGSDDHFLNIWLLKQEFCATDANDLVVASLIIDELIKSLKTKEGSLAILCVLQQWHNKHPEEDFDDARVLFRYENSRCTKISNRSAHKKNLGCI